MTCRRRTVAPDRLFRLLVLALALAALPALAPYAFAATTTTTTLPTPQNELWVMPSVAVVMVRDRTEVMRSEQERRFLEFILKTLGEAETSDDMLAAALETALVEARQSAQSGRDGLDPAARLFAMKAEAGILAVWDELSRILPDHTFLTETRIADGTVTVSGFSADAARLVRIIDQSPLFSGATLTSAITPDANERKDRFSIAFKLRGARAATAKSRAGP